MNNREKVKREVRKTDAKAWAKQQDRAFEPTAIKLPEGVEYYKLDLGTPVVDFMPFITGKGNPRADAGFEHFEREYSAHRVPMPGGQTSLFLCLWVCFKKPCPICKWMQECRNVDQETLKKLKPQVRHLWLVNDKPGDTKNKAKVFDSNHFNRGIGFGEMVADAINSVAKYASFTDLVGGMSVQLTVKEQSMPGRKFNAVTRIDFLAREYDYPEDMLEKAICLDDCLIEMKYDDLKRVIEQGGEAPVAHHDSDNGEEEPIKARRKLASEDPEDDDDSNDDATDDDDLDAPVRKATRR